MDLNLERDSTALGSLFQQIITDMKNTSPLWEDFVAKASKLHACLRAAIQAIAAYLDAFQKIADAATNSRGASKEIGTALTRVCLRHKAVETRMKTFTSAIMDCLILPLQDKLEDWKRQVVILDKEHTKEYKRCRTELKKRSSDTLRLQKKARKGQSETIQSLVDSHMQDVTLRRAELEDVERKSLRAAMIEERMRFCSFVNMLQPVVKEECEVMSELGHLQEAMQSIAVVTKEPNVLPQSSEELILESKSTLNLYPESPGGNSGSQGCSNSLGSRKSSVCSISSMNSSGSSGSPGHHHYQRSLSQLISPAIRLKPGESSDSGFCSSPALTSQVSTTTSQSHAVSTWPPHSQDVVQTTDRPHTISSAYEKGHQRPALTVYTFQNPETIMEAQKSPAPMSCRPPLPVRCSSLERPLSATGNRNNNSNLTQRQCPSPIPAHITKELPQHQPTYVNMSELASMAAMKITNQQLQQQHQQIIVQQQQQQQQQQKPQYQQINSNNSTPQSTTSSSLFSSDSPSASANINQSQYSSSDLSSMIITGNAIAIPSAALPETIPSSGDTPPQLATQNNSTQLTNFPQTPLTGGNDSVTTNINNKEIIYTVENELKITETDVMSITNLTTATVTTTSTAPTTNNSSSILNNQNSPTDKDDKSRGSVLEKLSMFEKLEQQQSSNNNPPPLSSGRSSHSISTSSGDSIYGNRKEDVFNKTSSSTTSSSSTVSTGGAVGAASAAAIATIQPIPAVINDKDPDQIYEDSIQELNNLIGELDSFQREHEMKEQGVIKLKQQPEEEVEQQQQQQHQQQLLPQIKDITIITTAAIINNNNNNNNINQLQTSCIDTDSDKISIGSLNYSTQSTSASDVKLTYSDSELSRYVSESSSVGFENPTFAHFNNTGNDDIDSTSDHHPHHNGDDDDNDDDDVDSINGHITIYDHTFVPPEVDYMKQNSEIVVLRCKDISTLESFDPKEPKQRLSSFRGDLQQLQQQQQQQRKRQSQQQKQQEQHQQQKQHYYQNQQEYLPPPPPPTTSTTEHPSSPSLDQGMKSNDDYTLSKKNLKRLENSLIDETSPSAMSMKNFKANLDERLRLKPIISPRPASLSGCVTRIARRSSINNTKPPPPVRRSSSVTPSHNLAAPNSPNLIQQNTMNTSTESLPPPPAYLLDRTTTASPPTSIKVSETVKALTVIRHTPASPSAIRRAQNHVNQPTSVQCNKQFNNTTISTNTTTTMNLFSPINDGSLNSSLYNNTPQTPNPHTINTSSENLNSSFRTTNSSSPGIYAQPKQVTKMSSFRTPSPGPQKTSSSLLAQLNARLTPSKSSSTASQQSPHTNDYGSHHHHNYQENRKQSQTMQSTYSSGPNSPHHNQNYVQSEQIYSRGGDRYYYGAQQQQPQQQQHQQHHQQQQYQHEQYQQSQSYDDYAPSNTEKSGSIRAKTKAEFLENLNAKLAKQNISGRAFAVRNLINSKALPDPRLCHESLMDQIKRGATLKRNRTINDRSAPKIH